MVNDPGGPLGRSLAASRGCISPFGDFDLQRIASRRRANSLLLDKLLLDLAPEIEPLFGAPGCGEFPHSYPVLIRSGARDRVYQDMNAAGFGVVSLYHTLIPQIPPAGFPAAGGVSRHILNLPVHQDAAEETLHAMVRELARCVRRT
jgi:dTDP-4-amino-4,6-dideoxygalactose transaminase